MPKSPLTPPCKLTLRATAALLFTAGLAQTAMATPHLPQSPRLEPPPPAFERDYDVLDYDLALNLNPTTRAIDGIAHLLFDVRSDLSLIEIDLEGLTAYEIHLDDQVVEFTHVDDLLQIPLDSPLAAGETHTVSVHYGGVPYVGSDKLGLTILTSDNSDPSQEGVAFTITEPEGSRRWFPCNDTPGDKATLRLSVTVPDGWSVAANGILEEIDPLSKLHDTQAPATTYIWEEEHQIATYLVAFAAAPYHCFDDDSHPSAERCQDYVGQRREGDGPIPIQYFARPALASTANAQWRDTRAQLDAFIDLFTDYPFEKYGTVEAPMPFAAMEHQGMTLWGTHLITSGSNSGPRITAHELAHHWFGNLVTPKDWNDIWLNEGWATYGEALWFEYAARQNGTAAAAQVLAEFMGDTQEIYKTYYHIENATSVYGPQELFGVTVYEKGATIVHMLRFILGDDSFFEMSRDYLETYAYGNVTTDDFITLAETYYGGSLDWFFDPYLFTAGNPFPQLDVGWKIQGNTVTLGVSQLGEAPIFTLLLPVEFTLANGEIITQKLWVEPAPATQFALNFSDDVESIRVDPQNWWLAQINLIQSVPGDACENPTYCEGEGTAFCDGATCDESGGCGCAQGHARQPGDLMAGALLFTLGLLARQRRKD